MRVPLTICLMMVLSSTFGQYNIGYSEQTNLSVSVNGTSLRFASVGGINTPQFSEIDLNQDGLEDLFLFDRDGDHWRTFIWNSSSDQYDYSPEYERYFPKDLVDLTLLRDYNCDGAADIFSYTLGGLRVFQNDGSDPPAFNLVSSRLNTFYGNLKANAFVLGGDIPALVDVDGDSDLDMLAFGLASSENSIEYHRNFSIEEFGSCDSLIFRNQTQCWGNVEEPSNSSILIQKFCKGIVAPSTLSSRMHPGSSILLRDLDGDGDKDLMVGDIQTGSMVRAINVGDATTASIDINQQTTTFPADAPLSLPFMASGYEIDVDHDGKKDIVFAPNNTIDSSANAGHVWHFRDASTTSATALELVTKQFLIEDMIDLGDGVSPALFDVDGDGLLDLLLASSFRKTPAAGRRSRIHYYRNTGSTTTPSFELVESDFAELSQFQFQNAAIDLADIDNDGDQDLLLGDADGWLHLFQNNPSSGVAQFSLVQPQYQGINSIGAMAVPHFNDLDNDGDFDLLVGQKNGHVLYFENSGTPELAQFDADPTIEQFGKIDVSFFCCGGNAAPLIVENSSFGPGRFLFIGTDEKKVMIYRLTDNLNDSLVAVDSLWINASRVKPAIIDLTGDNNPDLLIGTGSGGIKYYKRSEDIFIGEQSIEQIAFRVYPNPANSKLSFDWGSTEAAQIKIYNYSGQLVSEISGSLLQGQNTLDIERLADGFYVLMLSLDASTFSSTFIKISQ